MTNRNWGNMYFEILALRELVEFACKKLEFDIKELGRLYLIYKGGLEKEKEAKKK